GLGVGRLLLEACLERAQAAGAPVICLHTAEFMPAAVAIYEAAGFRRDPVHDFDAAGHLAPDGGVRPVPILAFRLDLVPHHTERSETGVAVDLRPGGRRRRSLRQRFVTARDAHPARSTR
ncbi:MAG TPA: GNAT family N-acetyltransferase, partial [Actinomycetes bacterium]|nr:GNAT family N-acetyltransferase [Actinomycetes bacterium]